MLGGTHYFLIASTGDNLFRCSIERIITEEEEERFASTNRVERISELGTALAVTSNQLHSITFQKMILISVTTVKNSNLAIIN
jgi:hypothetical protein